MYYDEELLYTYKTKTQCVIIKRKTLSVDIEYYDYQLRWDEFLLKPMMLSIAEWCEENCKEDWLVGMNVSGFIDEFDFVAFKLRWL